MLVTLDCTDIGQGSRNALFMSNRETFRDDTLLTELFRKLQKELHDHDEFADKQPANGVDGKVPGARQQLDQFAP